MKGGRSFEGRGGLVLIKRERGWRGGQGGGGRAAQLNLCVKTIQGDKSDGFGEKKRTYMHLYMYICMMSPTHHPTRR